MTHKIGNYLLNIALGFLIWMVAWTMLDIVPIFAKPLVSDWSIAKGLGMFLAVFILQIAGHRLPFLRL